MPVNVNVGVKALTPYTQRMNQLLEEINNSEAEKRTKDVQVIRDLINNFQSATNINRTPTAVELMTGNKNVQQPAAQVDPLKTLEDFNEQRKAQRMKLAEYEDMVAQDEITKKAMADEIERQKQEAINKRMWEGGEKSIQRDWEGGQKALDRASREKTSREATDRTMALANMRNNIDFLKMQAENAKANERMTFDAEQGKLNREWKGGESDKDRALREAQIKETERKNKEYEKFLKDKADLEKQKYDWMTSLENPRNKPKVDTYPQRANQRTANQIWTRANDKLTNTNSIFGKNMNTLRLLDNQMNLIDQIDTLPVNQLREIESSMRNIIAGGKTGQLTGTERGEQYLKTLPGTEVQKIRQFLSGKLSDVRTSAPEIIEHLQNMAELERNQFAQNAKKALKDLDTATEQARKLDPDKQKTWEEYLKTYSQELKPRLTRMQKRKADLEQAKKDYYNPNTPQEVRNKILKTFGKELGL